jgi:hypothetical protein
VICAMSHISRMPFYLWRNVVSLFFLNLKVSRLFSLLGIFKVKFFIYLTSRGLCCGCKFAKKILQKSFCKKYSSSSWSWGVL